jgi:hypothetical protein
MKRHYKKIALALTAAVLSMGFVFATVAQPPGAPYVELRAYLDGNGTVVAMQYISHGCASPQPAGWGTPVGKPVIWTQICFGSNPNPGGF